MKYRFVEVRQQEYPVRRMCALLGISRSGYYAWKKRKPSQRAKRNEELVEEIRKIHKKSRAIYGSPRVHAEMKKQGYGVNQKTVARLMRQEGLVGVRKNRKVRTTDSNHRFPVAPNLLNRDFTAEQPNQKWAADITYIPTEEGWLYLAGVLDLFSRKIVGWAMSSQIDANLVEQALRMAFYLREPGIGLLHHSDRGSQYASYQIHDLLASKQIQISMSRRADCYDNSVMESFFSTLKNEWVHHRKYKTRAQARTDIFSYIEGFYNTVRLHSTLGYCSPNEFEALYHNSP